MNKYICSDKVKQYLPRIESIIDKKKQSILDFFKVHDSEKFSYTIYVYDTIESLKEGLEERGFRNIPDYCCACFRDEDQSLNFFEPKDPAKENEWSKDEYDLCIYHELIHAIQYTIYGFQPEWLTEGIAKYLDGTYTKGIKWLLENYIINNSIPPMSELEEEFGFHDYDSYDYAYIMISYLIETMGKDDFLMSIKDSKKISQMSENLVEKAINYYEKC